MDMNWFFKLISKFAEFLVIGSILFHLFTFSWKNIYPNYFFKISKISIGDKAKVVDNG